jgi:hypothetical protein
MIMLDAGRRIVVERKIDTTEMNCDCKSKSLGSVMVIYAPTIDKDASLSSSSYRLVSQMARVIRSAVALAARGDGIYSLSY